MNSTEILYALCTLPVFVAAAAGLSKLKRALKRYGSKSCADRAAE